MKLITCITITLIVFILTSCTSHLFVSHDTTKNNTIFNLNHLAFWKKSPFVIWAVLQQTSSSQLMKMQLKSTDPDRNAWLQLALIHKYNNLNGFEFIQKLLTWQKNYATHPGAQLIPDYDTLTELLKKRPPQHIAVLLPLHGPYARAGKTIRDGILNAYYANLSTINKQSIMFYDTAQKQDIVAIYQSAVHQGADFIIGPLLKDNVTLLLEKIDQFPITTLALNYTPLSFSALPTHFYEFGLSPDDEINCMVKHAKKMGHKHAIIIAASNQHTRALVKLLSKRWENDSEYTIQDIFYYTEKTDLPSKLSELLKIQKTTKNSENLLDDQINAKLTTKDALDFNKRRQDFDIIFLLASSESAHRIVPLLRYNYVDTIPIYATASVYSGKPNPIKDADLNEVSICDVPRQYSSSSTDFLNTDNMEVFDRLYAVGQDAYLISQASTRLINIPYFSLYGQTGALTISSRQRIHRSLPCITIHHGKL